MSTQEGAYTAATHAGKSPRATRRRVGREEVGRARLLAQAATAEAVGELTRLGLDAFVQVLLPEIFAIDLARALPPAIVTEVAAVGSQRPGRGGADLVA